MDARFLDYYNRELAYLRELGGEFAAAFPRVAGRLGMQGETVADPYVERLLEGFAFLVPALFATPARSGVPALSGSDARDGNCVF